MSAVLKMRMNGKNYFIIMADIVLSITGNKKIGTLMKEFNEKYPYLIIKFKNKTIKQFFANKEGFKTFAVDETIASVRKINSVGEISIAGNKMFKTLSSEFEIKYGMYMYIGVVDEKGSRILYHSFIDDGDGSPFGKKTLSELNDISKKNGAVKGEWK